MHNSETKPLVNAMTENVSEDGVSMTQSQDSRPVSQELLPCPFCGGEAEIEPKNWAGRDFMGVFCKECLIFQDGRSSTDAEAIALWNTRHRIAALSRQEASGEVREALSEALDLVDGLYRTYGLELNGVDAATARKCRDIALSAQPLADAGDVEREESLDEIAQNIGYGSALEALGDLATRKFAPSTAPDKLRAEGDVVEQAFEGRERIDREALDRYRTMGWGHDHAPINLTTMQRLIGTIDYLAALARPDRMAEMEGALRDDPNDVTAGLSDEAIQAGIAAWDAAKHDMENYVSGETADWDEGMIVAAIFKAVGRAALSGSENNNESS